MWERYVTATTVQQALSLLAAHGPEACVMGGGTDLIIEIERRTRFPKIVIDVSRIGGLDEIRSENGVFHLGASVTHNQAAAHNDLVERAFPLASACWQVGSPQIRNRGTIAGNLITASPANDTSAPLIALGARVTLQSERRGPREVALEEFVLGPRCTLLEPDEMMTGISFAALKENAAGTFAKLGLRWGQAVSVANAAVVLEFRSPERQSEIQSANITLGSVSPTVVRAEEAQKFLIGKTLEDRTVAEAARLAIGAARPIDDIRGSADYRREMVEVLVGRALASLRDGGERDDFPSKRVMLWGRTNGRVPIPVPDPAASPETIETTINGKDYSIKHATGKTLLGMLREDIGLMGTKEGCEEGRCGACTVFLDGIAVVACLVPAARAHRATVVTIEGLQSGQELHPVQTAFIQAGAVQCGYCSPGFVMSGAKLLEEVRHPTREEIRQALSGILCRCTGYSRILRAVELAAGLAEDD